MEGNDYIWLLLTKHRICITFEEYVNLLPVIALVNLSGKPEN